MKLALASTSVSSAFDRGDVTQLEFIDAAARTLRCDGVVVNVRHFPRVDSDYLAQVKKMAADVGLCVTALESDAFFSAGEAAMRADIEMALAIGAPLLVAPLAHETAMPWSEQLANLWAASGLAKAANVTLAVRNAPGTFAASAHDCKRVTKEADSAWLRLALDPAAFDAASEWNALLAKTVIGFERSTPQIERWDGSAGWLAIDSAGSASLQEMNEAMRGWRIARANLELNRT